MSRNPRSGARLNRRITWPRGRVGIPFCIGRLWQGIEAMFRGLIHIPYLLRRLRRSRVYGGFVFVLVLCVCGGFASSV